MFQMTFVASPLTYSDYSLTDFDVLSGPLRHDKEMDEITLYIHVDEYVSNRVKKSSHSKNR